MSPAGLIVLRFRLIQNSDRVRLSVVDNLKRLEEVTSRGKRTPNLNIHIVITILITPSSPYTLR